MGNLQRLMVPARLQSSRSKRKQFRILQRLNGWLPLLTCLAVSACLSACSAPGTGPGKPMFVFPAEPDSRYYREPTALTVTVDAHPLRVWYKPHLGPVSRGAMLLLHGRTWSSRPDFDLQVPGEQLNLMDGLTALGFEVYALDQRGYGETPRDASGWLTPNRARDDTVAIINWLKQRTNTQPLRIFGWSYGTLIGQLAVQAQPESIDGFIAFGYPVRAGVAVTPEALRTASEPPAVATTAAAAVSDFITPGSISRKATDAFVTQALEADPIRVDWRELEQWEALDPTAVKVPTLLIEGALDPLAIDTEQARFFEGLQNHDKRWVVLPHGDHAAFMESSRIDFLRAIDSFTHPDRPPVPGS